VLWLCRHSRGIRATTIPQSISANAPCGHSAFLQSVVRADGQR
jgi:hypothetical protein